MLRPTIDAEDLSLIEETLAELDVTVISRMPNNGFINLFGSSTSSFYVYTDDELDHELRYKSSCCINPL